jgi:hypothetical protein
VEPQAQLFGAHPCRRGGGPDVQRSVRWAADLSRSTLDDHLLDQGAQQLLPVAWCESIVPTETGLALFGVLKQAAPALVDPGVTAQLECLLDDVVVGKQEMVGAIDAVCDVAQRIIGKLKDGAVVAGAALLGATRPAMALQR